MAIILSDNIKVNAPKPVDSRYLNITTPWVNVAAVNAAIPIGERYVGLTVNIDDVEYWYKAGTTNGDLVAKQSEIATVGVTGATNGITKTGQNVELGGDLTKNTVLNGTGSNFNLRYAGNYSSAYTNRSLVDAGYVTGLTSTSLSKSAFNTYSGVTNTLIGTKASAASVSVYTGNTATAFNIYSGVTNTLIGTKASAASVSVYTGTTATALFNDKTSQSNLAVYTGVTATALFNAKTSQSNLAVYTGATDTRIDNLEIIGNNAVTGATNGLTKIGRNICLGGALDANTTIDIDSGSLTLNGTVGQSYQFGHLGVILDKCGSQLYLTNNGADFQLKSCFGKCVSIGSNGLKYGSDYSADYVSRSLVDAAYVTGKTITSGIQTASNGLTKSGTNVVLGGLLSSNTTISGGSELNITTPFNATNIQNFVFDETPTPDAYQEGRLFYKNNTLNLDREISGVTLQIGEEQVMRVKNASGSLIENGSLVYIVGAASGYPTIAKSIASNLNSAKNLIGMVTHNIPDNNEGYVTLGGIVNGLNTSGYAAGTPLYLSTTAGEYTDTIPTYPNEPVRIGYVINEHATEGQVEVSVFWQPEHIDKYAFDIYSGNTLTLINTKTTQANLAVYTGATNTRINNVESVAAVAVTGGTNGIGKNLRNACLGGALTNDTTICSASNTLTLGKLCGITLNTAGASSNMTLVAEDSASIYLQSVSGNTFSNTFVNAIGLFIDANATSGSGFKAYDNRTGTNQVGIVYASDYSPNYVDRSLVDKAYVDSVATGLNVHNSTCVATTENITLSGNQTIDGITTLNGWRVLVKNQSAGWQNGIYIATGSTWQRAEDYNFAPTGEVTNGDLIPVVTGNTNLLTQWVLTTPNPITSGDTLTFSLFSKATSIIQGNGIDITTVGGSQQISTELASNNSGLCYLGSGLRIDDKIFSAGLSFVGGVTPQVSVRATRGAALSSEIGVRINTGGTNVLYVDSSAVAASLAAVTGATNGICKYNNNNVCLGGTLTGDIAFNGGSTYDVSLNSLDSFNLGFDNVSTITDSGTNGGLRYAGDYSGNYVARSLVDKGYVDGQVTTGVLACNGLTKQGNTVVWGGTLTGDTQIIYGANRLCFTDGGTSSIDVLSDCSHIHVENTSLYLQSCTDGTCNGTISIVNTGAISLTTNNATLPICITAPNAMKYAGDYSGTFTSRSIPDAAWVTGMTTTAGIQTVNNGLTKVGTNACLGGTLVANTLISGAYTLSVCSGAKLNTDAGYQISGTTMFKAQKSLTNIAIGQLTLTGVTTGLNNIAAGCGALARNTKGCGNTAIGSYALRNNFEYFDEDTEEYCYGNNNIAIGEYSLFCNTIGCNNIAQGLYALSANTTGCHNIAQGMCTLLSNTTGCYNIAQGINALRSNTTGGYNIAQGINPLRSNTTGSHNIAQGSASLFLNTTGCHNIAQGVCTLRSNTTGCHNIAQGMCTLLSNTIGCNNIAQGECALFSNTTGCFNIAQGLCALFSNTTGCNNIAQGESTLSSNICGVYNIGIGQGVLRSNISGHSNTAIGTSALRVNISGNQNNAFGSSALYFNTTGCHNSAFGASALYENTTGCQNIGIGLGALYTNSTGCYNIAIGTCAGRLSLGSGNIYIGNTAGCAETGSNKLYIANTGTVNPLIYGDFAAKCAIVHGAFKTSGATSLLVAPVAGATSDSILVWNSSDKLIKTVSGGAVLTSALTGATNGLTKVGQNVVLGGTLTGNTTIDIGSNTLSLGNAGTGTIALCGNLNICTNNGTITSTNNHMNICANQGDAIVNLSSCGSNGYLSSLTITSSNATYSSDNPDTYGILYGNDYSACFVDRSLVDKAYVNCLVSGGIVNTITGATNGLTKVGQDVCLGGSLISDTFLTGDGGQIFNIDELSSFKLATNTSATDKFSITALQGAVTSGTVLENENTVAITSICLDSSLKLSAAATTLNMGVDTTIFTDDGDGKGIQYNDEYWSNYTDRSLVDKGYVTSLSSQGITGATNGLTKVGQNVCLGGTLSSNTTINGATQSLTLGNSGSPISDFSVYTASGLNLQSNGGNNGINLTSTSLLVTDGTNSRGLIYAGTYNSNFVSRSLITASYVTGITTTLLPKSTFVTYTGATSTLIGTKLDKTFGSSAQVLYRGATCIEGSSSFTYNGTQVVVPNLCITGAIDAGDTTDAILVWDSTDKLVKQVAQGSVGDKNNRYSMKGIGVNTLLTTSDPFVILVTGGTTITITLPASPDNGQVFKIKDARGTALTNLITINGNGNGIDGVGGTNALINTDWGALELVYNLGQDTWYSMAFIN